MRDVERIRPFLSEFEKLWEKNPDLRFGQLVYIMMESIDCIDIFYPEEDQWLEAMKAAGTPDYSNYKISSDLEDTPWVTNEEEWVKELLKSSKNA